MAVGLVHLSTAQARAAVRGGFPGRSLALFGQPDAGASPTQCAGARGAGARDCRLRSTARDSHRSRQTIHRVARFDGVRGGAASPRDRARQEPTPSSADLREDREVLEDDVGGVPCAHRVCGLRGLSAPRGVVRTALQLSTSSPSARRHDAGGPLLSLRLARTRRDRSNRGRERASTGARATAA
jgi:hypothetical protein